MSSPTVASGYPRCKSLGLIEAGANSISTISYENSIRGVKASASLKRPAPGFRARGYVHYPRCKSLGLIEASWSRIGIVILRALSEV